MTTVQPAETRADVITVEGLVKRYGWGLRRKHALRGVSLTVREGSAFGLVGPNGAGKTTLLKSLLGVVRIDAGVVRVLGRDPSDVEARRQIGYLPERQHLPPAWSALGFLLSVGRIKRLPDPKTDALRLLERVGLASEAHARIGTFSKGMRQRLALAAALIGSPKLLVLDEPTDGVDPKGRADVRVILQEELARGATVLINSHLLSETQRVCDQIGILVRGQLLKAGATAELCATSDLEAVLLKLMEQADA